MFLSGIKKNRPFFYRLGLFLLTVLFFFFVRDSFNEASKNLDGDEFLGYYLTSSIQSDYYKFDFWEKGVTGSIIGETFICPIREF